MTERQTDLSLFTRTRFTDTVDIVTTVRDAGLIIFPGLLSPDQLEGLRGEFYPLIEQAPVLGFHIDRQNFLINARIVRAAIADLFPQTYAFFDQPFMEGVVKGLMGEMCGTLNELIFVNQTEVMTQTPLVPPFCPHFDRRRVVKFFVYLDDTTTDNGAMWAAPGSQTANRQARTKHQPSEPWPAATESGLAPIEGPAGTLFIFDTEMSHKAGHVARERRRIMRGHTYFTP